MKALSHIIFYALLAMLVSVCSTPDKRTTTDDIFRKPDKYNFKFTGFDADIKNPDKDRRSYYKIFIDKAEEGRTTTGLESQEKSYEAVLSPNRHLIKVEKWVLDQKSGRYVKLNNIEQPKPDYMYFLMPENKIVIIEMKSRDDGDTEFKIDYERK